MTSKKTNIVHALQPEMTASIALNCHCGVCGWPVVFACCNGKMADLHPMEDYWMYCSNQGCEHHAGEAYGQSCEPSFICFTNS